MAKDREEFISELEDIYDDLGKINNRLRRFRKAHGSLQTIGLSSFEAINDVGDNIDIWLNENA